MCEGTTAQSGSPVPGNGALLASARSDVPPQLGEAVGGGTSCCWTSRVTRWQEPDPRSDRYSRPGGRSAGGAGLPHRLKALLLLVAEDLSKPGVHVLLQLFQLLLLFVGQFEPLLGGGGQDRAGLRRAAKTTGDEAAGPARATGAEPG